jgi:hypothetical protein
MDESSDNESVGSLKEFIVPDVEVENDEVTETVTETLVDIVEPVQGTVVGGRMLRSRNPESIEMRKPRDEYYERFGRKEEEKLLLQDTKKDIVKFVATLEAEWKTKYEESGSEWPKLNVRMSLEKIREEYQKIKDFAGLPDSDDESSDVEEETNDSEVDEESDEDEDDEEEDEEEDEDEEEESEDEDDEDDDLESEEL